MILTHLAFARNIIPVFYNILKCVQILRRFYVKRRWIPNFKPVVSWLIVGTSRLSLQLLRTALLVFLNLKIFIHVRGLQISIQRLLNLFTFIVYFQLFAITLHTTKDSLHKESVRPSSVKIQLYLMILH